MTSRPKENDISGDIEEHNRRGVQSGSGLGSWSPSTRRFLSMSSRRLGIRDQEVDEAPLHA